MELEKALKCCSCDATFPASDLLQIHQRRHEMSLNLSFKPSSSTSSLLTPSILNKGSISAGIIGFVDETPTPTRFIRNCEEVGLFQDLQNVNPFDEDFKRAADSATATPSGGESAFDFSFASAASGSGPPTTPISLRTSRSKRRYSDQDSLNTPQVFPYLNTSSGYHLPTLTTNTASMSACLTPTPQNSVISQESLRSVLQIETPTTPTTTYNHEEHVSIIAYTSVISRQRSRNESNDATPTVPHPPTPTTTSSSLTGAKDTADKSATAKSKSNSAEIIIEKSPVLLSPHSPSKTFSSLIGNEGHMGSRISLLKIRSKSNLKLDLKTTISRSGGKSVIRTEKRSYRASQLSNAEQLEETSGELAGTGQTKREILERKRAASHRSRERRKQWIDGLESKCRELETLLAQSRAEVAHLKKENDSLRSQQMESDDRLRQIDVTRRDSSPTSISNGKSKDLSLIHQSCQTELQDFPSHIQDRLPNVEPTSSTNKMTTILSTIVLPTVKAKRGRPRKGQERRVPILSVPIKSSTDELKTPPPKIPILPLPDKRLLINKKGVV